MASEEETTSEGVELETCENSPETCLKEVTGEKTEFVTGDTTTFEELSTLAGTNGLWNHGFACLLFIGALPSAFLSFSYQFLGATPEYWCHIQELRDANWTSQQIIDFAVPRRLDGMLEGCLQWNYNYTLAATLGYEVAKENISVISNAANGTVTCPTRDFNLTEYSSTVVTEFDLVCERRALYSTTTSVLQAGAVVASLSVGYVTEIIGKRRTILMSYVALWSFGLMTMLSSSVEMYLVGLSIIAIFRMVNLITEYVLLLELSSYKLRSYLGCFINIPYSIGQMLIPLIASYINEWRYLLLAFLAPFAYAISYFWLLPESPRWLLLRRRYNDAINFLKTVARWNRRTLPCDDELMEKVKRINIKDTEESQQGDNSKRSLVRHGLDQLSQLFETKIKIIRTLVLFFCWFTIALVYYGVTHIGINIGSNKYWYMFFGGLVELVATLISWPLILFLGRRLGLAGSLLLCAVSLLGSLGVEAASAGKTALALLGKFGISIAFLLVYLVTAEINTTKTRTLAVGIGSMVARFGGVLSPYINDIIGDTYPAAPATMFGVFSCAAGFLALLLPETRGAKLPESKVDIENIGSNMKMKHNEYPKTSRGKELAQ